MNNLEELLKEVKYKIHEEECVKEYFRLKEVIDNDPELNKLNEEMRLHQKKMCENINNDEIYFKEKELYESSLKRIEENPIYQNFKQVRSEVNMLLIEIKDYLN